METGDFLFFEKKIMVEQLQKLKDNKTIIFQLQQLIKEIVESTLGIAIEPDFVEVSPTQDAKFGDYTSNIGLKLAKIAGKNPRELGQMLAEKLESDFIAKAEVAGPGFVNMTLNKHFYAGQLNTILTDGETYGKWDLENAQVMIEFGQPNTHKAFHVGHLKSAISGLALANLVKNLGLEVIQANFYGDVGMHVAKSVWGFMQQGKPEGFEAWDPHAKMKYIDQCYVYGAKQFKEDPNAEAEIREINKKIYSKTDDAVNMVYLQTRQWSIEHQTETFKSLGVVYDRQYPESEIEKHAVEIVNKYNGEIFIEDQGAIIFPGENYDLSRWVFLTGERIPTYEAKDLALAYKKFEEFPQLSLSIITTSVEQVAHFKAVIKVLELIDTKFTGKYLHVPFGWMLRSDGKKFSSRMGDTIKGIDILNEARDYALQKISEGKKYTEEDAALISEKVAVAGLKFLVLSHELHKDFRYDPEQFINPEGFSGPYLLYGYVRAKSILRQAGEIAITSVDENQLNDAEISLMRLLSKYPSVTLSAGKTLSPHIVCSYLFELTQQFNQYYRENKVLVEEESVKHTRLALVKAVATVLGNGLHLLGIDTIEQM
jgi:arginyl-tRNA synthetase